MAQTQRDITMVYLMARAENPVDHKTIFTITTPDVVLMLHRYVKKEYFNGQEALKAYYLDPAEKSTMRFDDTDRKVIDPIKDIQVNGNQTIVKFQTFPESKKKWFKATCTFTFNKQNLISNIDVIVHWL